jgi:hypothetical protein
MTLFTILGIWLVIGLVAGCIIIESRFGEVDFDEAWMVPIYAALGPIGPILYWITDEDVEDMRDRLLCKYNLHWWNDGYLYDSDGFTKRTCFRCHATQWRRRNTDKWLDFKIRPSINFEF